MRRATSGEEIGRAIGERVKALRLSRYGRRLTQGEIARAAGVSVSYLSMIERGERSPAVETLSEIAGALGVPLAELFRIEDRDDTPDPALRRLHEFAKERSLRKGEVERLATVARALFPA